jgi:hypothetical protein
VVSWIYPQPNATSLLIGSQLTRNISIPTDLSPCIRVLKRGASLCLAELPRNRVNFH